MKTLRTLGAVTVKYCPAIRLRSRVSDGGAALEQCECSFQQELARPREVGSLYTASHFSAHVRRAPVPRRRTSVSTRRHGPRLRRSATLRGDAQAIMASSIESLLRFTSGGLIL